MMSAQTHINPSGLLQSSASTQVITVEQLQKTIFIGGQNATDAEGNVVGKADLAVQTAQVLANLQTALLAAGAGFKDVVKITLYLTAQVNATHALEVYQKTIGPVPHPPTISLLVVTGFINPEYLIEIDAIAVL